MKYKEIKEKTADERIRLLAETKGKLVLFKFHASASQESNVRKGRRLRHVIARILTAMRQEKQDKTSTV